MNDIQQAAEALRAIGQHRAAAVVEDVVNRQYARRGIKPWVPGGKLDPLVLAESIRGWVQSFDVPIYYRGWPQDGHVMLMGAFKLQPALA